MDTESQRIVLRHGTTRKRAEAILRDGPDPNFVEPLSPYTAEAFYAAPAGGPFPVGTPEYYASMKARLYPGEGGPAVLELEVPVEIVRLAVYVGDYRFDWEGGLAELLEVWPTLPKRII